MGGKSRREYLRAIQDRYCRASKAEKGRILDEFCSNCGYNRKYAIRLLHGGTGRVRKRVKRRAHKYGSRTISVLAAIWEAAGYPWSARLKALLPLWLPWARERFRFDDEVERQLLAISPATIDRRLQDRKRVLKRKLYGRTRPGTLLKHQIPIKPDAWKVTDPGFTEIDLVSHSGSTAEGHYIYSLNLTDIQTTWVETRAIMGRGQERVCEAMEQMRSALPFELKGIDSDNGSEFINNHLFRYCQRHRIQFTRGRPYKKDDNAHIEQKNWTHVRKIFGYERYDSEQALSAMNDLYRNELALLQNLFQPSVRLVRKVRVGSRVRRIYDRPQTPLQRVRASGKGRPERVAELQKLAGTLDPFELSDRINRQLERIYRLASRWKRARDPKVRGGQKAASRQQLYFGGSSRKRAYARLHFR